MDLVTSEVHFLISAAETACGLINPPLPGLAYDWSMVTCASCKARRQG